MGEALFTEYDGAITIHRFTDSSEAAIDAWAEAAARVIDITPPDENFMLLLDVSAKQVSFTPYARQKTVALFTAHKARGGRFAMLFSSRVAPHFARIFLASLGRLTFEVAYFSNREQALAWLREAQRPGTR